MSGRKELGRAEAREEEAKGSASGSHGEGYRTSPLHFPPAMMNPMQGRPVHLPMETGGRRISGSPTRYHAAPPMPHADQHLTTATATAVTPDSRQFALPEMMSPPSSTIRRRALTPGSGTTIMSSPAKRSRRTGEFPLFLAALSEFSYLRCGVRNSNFCFSCAFYSY